MENTLAWLWLAEAAGPAFSHAKELIELYPDPQALYEGLRLGREAPPYCLGEAAAARLCGTTPFDYEERLDHCLLSGVDILTPGDPRYPARLRELPDLPLVLYATGDTACLNGGCYIGMVGTRRPGAYGRQAAFELSLEMAKQGATIVSGLADGLDGEGHKAAVQAGAPTVAFLGTAIDKTYPAANAPLRKKIEQGGGAVCSEYPPGYPAKMKGTFLERNRLIAGLSQVLCVAEARSRSGTLNTVGHAERYGRPVLAVPGSIYSPLSEGTNELLRTHRAEPLCRAADALALVGLQAPAEAPKRRGFVPSSVGADARAVYAVLSQTPRDIGELCLAAGLPAGRVMAACTELELNGGAQALPGKRYIAI